MHILKRFLRLTSQRVERPRHLEESINHFSPSEGRRFAVASRIKRSRKRFRGKNARRFKKTAHSHLQIIGERVSRARVTRTIHPNGFAIDHFDV